MTHYDQGMTKREFLEKIGKGTVVAGATYMVGSTLGCSPWLKMPDTMQIPYDKFVQATLSHLNSEGRASKIQPIDWKTQEGVGKYASTLDWLQATNEAAAGVVKGHKLHFDRTLHSIHGDRAEFAKALKLSPEAQAKFVESYMSTLSDDQRVILRDAYQARDSLTTQLGKYPVHRANMAEIRAKVDNKSFGPLDDAVLSLTDSYLVNASQVQANLRAQIWMGVSEAQYAHQSAQLGQMIGLDDKIEHSLGRQKFTDQGKQVFGSVVVNAEGKDVILGDLAKAKVDAAEAHFRSRDKNYEHDIIVDNRSPVARAIIGAYAVGDIGLSQAQGAYHTLDLDLNTAARVQPEGQSTLMSIINYLPGIHFIGSLEDWALAGTSNAPTGNEAQVLQATSKAYVGYPSFRAGDEDPTGRALFALLMTAIEAGLIYAAVDASKSSSSGGRGGQGVGGEQTTTPGITNQGR